MPKHRIDIGILQTMRSTLFILFLFLNCHSFSQGSIEQNNMSTRITILEEKGKLIDEKINQLQKEIDTEEKNINDTVITAKDDTKSLINTYVFSFTGALAIIAFLINFFGAKAIKKRVEEIISETAKNHIERKIIETLNSKITNELIEDAIRKKSDELLKNIEEKGNNTIDQLRIRGNEVIESIIASPPKAEVVQNKTQLTDSEISKQIKTLRAIEFFNFAFQSQDPIIQIELYKNVLELEPNDYNALNNIAVAYNKLDESEKAIEYLDRALEINDKFNLAYVNRAESYNQLNKYDLALQNVSKALAIEPNFAHSYSIKAKILTKQELYDEAEESISKAVEIAPNSGDVYLNQGFFYEGRKNYLESLRSYEKAESLNFADKGLLYNNMAVAYRRLKQFDKAIAYIQKARQFNPNFPNIDGTLALIYADQNDDERFYSYLKIALNKGCPVWNYLSDPGFDKFRNSDRLKKLIEPFKSRYFRNKKLDSK
jgi:tetratricopeptide (TPR) repeat protein